MRRRRGGFSCCPVALAAAAAASDESLLADATALATHPHQPRSQQAHEQAIGNNGALTTDDGSRASPGPGADNGPCFLVFTESGKNCHHRQPVSTLGEGGKLSTADLAPPPDGRGQERYGTLCGMKPTIRRAAEEANVKPHLGSRRWQRCSLYPFQRLLPERVGKGQPLSVGALHGGKGLEMAVRCRPMEGSLAFGKPGRW